MVGIVASIGMWGNSRYVGTVGMREAGWMHGLMRNRMDRQTRYWMKIRKERYAIWKIGEKVEDRTESGRWQRK